MISYHYSPHPRLYSFPTRRSSDLHRRGGRQTAERCDGGGNEPGAAIPGVWWSQRFSRLFVVAAGTVGEAPHQLARHVLGGRADLVRGHRGEIDVRFLVGGRVVASAVADLDEDVPEPDSRHGTAEGVAAV